MSDKYLFGVNIALSDFNELSNSALDQHIPLGKLVSVSINNCIRKFGMWILQHFETRTDYDRSRILILCAPNFFLGNAILLEPAVRMLRRSLPNAALCLLGTESYCEVFQPTGLVNRTISWDSSIWEKLDHIGYSPFWQYDIVFEAYAFPFLRTITEWALARRCELWMTHNLVKRLPFDGLHETDESLNVIVCKLGLTITEEDRMPKLHLTEAELTTGKKIAEKQSDHARPFIGIHPGSGMRQSWKRWPADNFIALGRKANQQFGATIWVFGGPDDVEVNELISKGIGTGAVDLTNIGTFRETAAVISQCDAFASNDSALMHAANAVKIPLVAIFGPTSPKKNRPIGHPRRIRILTPSGPCAHCYTVKDFTWPEKCEHRKCLQSILPDEVLEALAALLSNST